MSSQTDPRARSKKTPRILRPLHLSALAMRHFSVTLLVASILFSSILASQRPGSSADPSGVPDNDGDGNIPNLGDGNGIPDVSNATNPACIPWYGIRDAILGGIFHGRLTTLLLILETKADLYPRPLRRQPPRRCSARLPRRRYVTHTLKKTQN